MRRTYRVWTLEEKRAAVARMLSCRHAQLAAEMGISKRLLYSWRKHLWRLEQAVEPETTRERSLEAQILQLKQTLADQLLASDFFKGVLRRIEAQRQPSTGFGETASTRRSA